MIGYVTLGTNDLPRAAAFYDRLLAAVGATRAWQTERGIGWSTGRGPSLAVMKPFDGKAATAGNGTMVSLLAESREKVDELYELARELGAADEGAPGARSPKFYGAYFRDLDGNKLCVFRMG